MNDLIKPVDELANAAAWARKNRDALEPQPRALDWLNEMKRELLRPSTPAEIEEEARRMAERQAERDAGARSAALAQWILSVPELLRSTDWNDPRLAPYKHQISTIRGWKMKAKGIHAVGRSGRGKSRSVYDLARRLAVDELIPVSYLLQNEITRDINRDGTNKFLEKIDAIRRAPILVWDDFGKFAAIGSRKELLVSEIEALIDFRFSKGLPLLISSNAQDRDLTEIFGQMRGEPILRRLSEGCVKVDFGWK